MVEESRFLDAVDIREATIDRQIKAVQSAIKTAKDEGSTHAELPYIVLPGVCYVLVQKKYQVEVKGADTDRRTRISWVLSSQDFTGYYSLSRFDFGETFYNEYKRQYEMFKNNPEMAERYDKTMESVTYSRCIE